MASVLSHPGYNCLKITTDRAQIETSTTIQISVWYIYDFWETVVNSSNSSASIHKYGWRTKKNQNAGQIQGVVIVANDRKNSKGMEAAGDISGRTGEARK